MSGPNPIYVDFVVRGLDNVVKAMKSVSDAVVKAEKRSLAAAKAQTSDKVRIAADEAKQRVRIATEAEHMVATAERVGHQASTKRFRVEAAARREDLRAHIGIAGDKEAAERKFTQSVRRGLEARSSAEKKHHNDKEKDFEKLVALTEKWKSEEVATARAKEKQKQESLAALAEAGQKRLAAVNAKARAARESGAKDDAHYREVIAKAGAAEKKKQDVITAQAASAEKKRNDLLLGLGGVRAKAQEHQEAEKAAIAKRWQARVEHEEFSRRKQFLTNVSNAGGTAVKNATSVTGRVAKGLFDAVTTAGGGFSVQDAIQQRLLTDKEWALVGVNAVDPVTGKQLHPDMKKARAAARATSISTNTSELDLAKGIQVYQGRAGEVETGIRNLDFFAKTSKTMGESVETVMEMGGQLRAQNKNLDDAGMRKLLLDSMQQARVTSLNPVELARQAGKATAGAVDWVGNQADNQRRMLGLVGYTAPVAGSAAEAATAVNSLSLDANQHQSALTHFLGKGWSKGGRINMRQEDFIANVIEAAAKHKGGLGTDDDEDLGLIGRSTSEGGMGFGRRSIKVFRRARQDWNEAKAQGKSNEEAKAAVVAEMKKATEAHYDQKDMEKDFAEIMKTSAEQFGQAVNELKLNVGEALVPALKELIPTLKQLTPPLTAFLQMALELAAMAAQNPFKAFAGVVSAFFIQELVKAKIADTIKTMINTSMGGSGPGGVGPGGLGPAGAVSTPPSLSSAAGAVGAAAGMAAQTAVVADYVDQFLGAKSEGSTRGKALAAAVAAGGPEAEAANAEVEKARANSTTERQVAGYGDYATRLVTAALNPFAAVGQYASDKAAGALFGSDSGIEKSKEAVKSAETVSAFEKALETARTAGDAATKSLNALAEAANSAASATGGVANPANPKRGQSIPKRNSD